MRLVSIVSTLRISALGGLCFVMGACTHANDSVSLEQSVPSQNARMMALAPDQSQAPRGRPIVFLPGEHVASVKEHRYLDGLRQDVLLTGSTVHGLQNSMTVLARTSHQETLDEHVPLVRPSEPQIRSEIGGAFPHLEMQIAERESSNAYGPYGLALGRSASDVHCAYMWQWIDENRLPAEAALAGPISVRVRLCQAGATFDQMASEFDHMTIGGQAGVAAIEPLGVIEAPAAARGPIAPSRKPHQIAAHHARRATRVARHEEPAAAPEAFASGPRYMGAAPVATPVVQQAAAPVYQQAAASVGPKLSGDLPSQAYLGPSASTVPATKTAAAKYY